MGIHSRPIREGGMFSCQRFSFWSSASSFLGFFFFFLLRALSVVLLAMPILDFFLYSSYLTLVCLCVCVCSVMFDSATPGTVAHQASLSMEFSKQEYPRSGLPFLTPVNLPDSGIEPESLELTAWAGGLLTTLPSGK